MTCTLSRTRTPASSHACPCSGQPWPGPGRASWCPGQLGYCRPAQSLCGSHSMQATRHSLLHIERCVLLPCGCWSHAASETSTKEVADHIFSQHRTASYLTLQTLLCCLQGLPATGFLPALAAGDCLFQAKQSAIERAELRFAAFQGILLGTGVIGCHC